jgi:trehalose 6-phosphate phosphatase
LLEDLVRLDRPLLVALDVDGTVSPIVRDPDRAEIPARTLGTLRALAQQPGIVLALVTGRDLSSLRRMEQLEGIWRAVEHGGVVLAPGETPVRRELTSGQRDALERFREWVDATAHGAFIEHKPQAVAVHVRAIAADDPSRAEQLMDEADELATRLGLHVRCGKAFREAEAVPGDKGHAVREIFERSGAGSVLYIGDDLTDFPAIEVASERGVGVFVRSSEQRGTPTGSAVVLQNVDEVGAVLEGLLRRIVG